MVNDLDKIEDMCSVVRAQDRVAVHRKRLLAGEPKAVIPRRQSVHLGVRRCIQLIDLCSTDLLRRIMAVADLESHSWSIESDVQIHVEQADQNRHKARSFVRRLWSRCSACHLTLMSSRFTGTKGQNGTEEMRRRESGSLRGWLLSMAQQLGDYVVKS